MRRIFLLVALWMPLAAVAGEGLDRNHTVIVRQTVLVGIIAQPDPRIVCHEGDEDRTPHTVRSIHNQQIVTEDRWTSTGQEKVLCTVGGKVMLTLPAPKGRAKVETTMERSSSESSFHVIVLTLSSIKD